MTNRIKELRKLKGINQDCFAKEIGTTQQTISRIENGVYMPSIDLIINIAKYFYVSLDYLLGLSNEKQNREMMVVVNKGIENNLELVTKYKKLDKENQKTLDILLDRLLATQTK